MLYTGIVSVTFRKLTPAEIVSLVSEAGLEAIEWGGDVHVLSGDLKQARKVRNLTEQAGLHIASYGSYFKVGCDSNFLEVLETAIELGAPSIRIWAGNQGSADADELWWLKLIKEAKCISDLSQKRGIKLSYEYHNNTLTDSQESAIKFMQALNDDNVALYWQPQIEKTTDENLLIITNLSPWISNIHVFHYHNNQQMSLQEGRQDWCQYLNALPIDDGHHYVMLEFVKNSEADQFIKDAEVLKNLIKQKIERGSKFKCN